MSHTLGLLPVSLCPFRLQPGRAGLSGRRAGAWAGVSSGSPSSSRGYLTVARARQLFFVSIIYLPLLLTVMVLDKVK